MAFTSIAGGFELSAEDTLVVNNQRAITKTINDQFVQVGAVFLKMSGKNPVDDSWAGMNFHDTDLQMWIDSEDQRLFNVGFNLQAGWMDVDIDADDPDYNSCMVAALDHIGVDTRFRFGRRSVGFPTHVLVQLGEEEASNFDVLSRFEPKEFRIDGKRYHTQLRSYPTNITDKNLNRSAKQTVMPGSVYHHKSKPNAYDLSVWYTRGNEIAGNVQNIATTTPRRVSYNQVLRAIAYATFLYCIKDHWIEGQRQNTANKVAGWLARVVKDGQAMNNHESISADVFCPVDTDDIAEDLLQFVADFCGDDEAPMRLRSYRDAVEKLDRNPDAKIPGWPAIDALIGPEAVNALRTTFTPGSDVSVLTKMAERYAYDETDNVYIDRDRHRKNMESFTHEPGALERRHIDETVLIKGKPRAAFHMFETSRMRVKVATRNLYPDAEPGTILRVSTRGDILPEDAEDDSVNVFNTWRGWPVLPTTNYNEELMTECVTMLDRLLGYLTCDNPEQIAWVKEWTAWTFQYPAVKQQIAWVVVGGQGVGKSFMGNTFYKALMGALWGSSSASIIDNKFNVGPFVNKMLVFVDEVKFHNESGTDEVKKLIRSVDVPGMLKYGEGQNFRIFSRLMFASNTFDMAIGQRSAIDRALFYTKAYDHKFMGVTEMEFRSWTETLKTWFEEFAAMLERRDVREHFVHYFMNYPTNKTRVESIKHSSGTDSDILNANMRPSRRFAKFIIEEGRIHEDLRLEYPFSLAHLAYRIKAISETMNTKPIRTDLVLAEFEDAGLIEKHRAGYVFKYKYGTVLEQFGSAISNDLEKRYEFSPDEFGPNLSPEEKVMWKGHSRPKF